MRGTMQWTIEVGEKEVTYEVAYSVSPGCRETPRSYSSGGDPACPPEVEDVSVYYVTRGPDGKKARERRPEMDDLVSDDEVIEYALGRDADDHEAADEARAEARREDRMMGGRN